MTRRISSLTSRSVAFVSLLGALLIGGLMAGPVKAQSNNPLDALQAAIVALQTSVNALQASLNVLTAPPQANARITPAVIAEVTDSVQCYVVNVSDSTRMVRLDVVTGGGSIAATLNLTPGAIGGTGASGTGFSTHCKFTVLGGTRADIRAAMRIKVSGGAEPGLAIAAE